MTRDPESGALHLDVQTERGPQGPGYTIKGAAYGTVAELEAAVTSPEVGDQYNVGAAAPYNVYRWTGEAWEDQGTVQGPPGLDAPQINDDEALSTNPWSGLKTQEEIAKVEGKIYPCTAQALEDMSQEQQAELYTQGYRAIKTENNGTVVLLGLGSDGSLEWLGCNQPKGSILDNENFVVAQAGYGGMHGNEKYVADRWYFQGGDVLVAKQDDALTITPKQITTNIVGQKINDTDALLGKRLTAIVETSNTIAVCPFLFPENGIIDTNVTIEGNWRLSPYRIHSNAPLTIRIVNVTGVDPISIKRVSLILGSYTPKTLPPWTTPDYVMEYMKCLWYYRALTSYGRIVFRPYGEVANTIVSSDEMRILPTAVVGAIRVFDDSEAWVVATVASVTWMGDGYKVRLNVNGTVSNGNTYLMQGFTGLTADL